jgi:hypothetical protein
MFADINLLKAANVKPLQKIQVMVSNIYIKTIE